jgi:hypothetical protein
LMVTTPFPWFFPFDPPTSSWRLGCEGSLGAISAPKYELSGFYVINDDRSNRIPCVHHLFAAYTTICQMIALPWGDQVKSVVVTHCMVWTATVTVHLGITDGNLIGAQFSFIASR